MTAVTCDTCSDTHRMALGEELTVPCTRCPLPCDACREGGSGAYCRSAPCDCLCHLDLGPDDNESRILDGWLEAFSMSERLSNLAACLAAGGALCRSFYLGHWARMQEEWLKSPEDSDVWWPGCGRPDR